MDYITKFAIYFKHFVLFLFQSFKVGLISDQIWSKFRSNVKGNLVKLKILKLPFFSRDYKIWHPLI